MEKDLFCNERVDVYGINNDKIVAGFHNRMKKIYDDDGKIPAIKFVREIVGIGLREAKEYVEETCEQSLCKLTVVGKRMSIKDLTVHIAHNYPGFSVYEEDL